MIEKYQLMIWVKLFQAELDQIKLAEKLKWEKFRDDLPEEFEP